jgi:hypothetical protein
MNSPGESLRWLEWGELEGQQMLMKVGKG